MKNEEIISGKIDELFAKGVQVTDLITDSIRELLESHAKQELDFTDAYDDDYVETMYLDADCENKVYSVYIAIDGELKIDTADDSSMPVSHLDLLDTFTLWYVVCAVEKWEKEQEEN